MASSTLLVAALLGLVLAGLYLEVGRRVVQRSRREKKPVQALFALFWIGIGLYGLVDALWALLVVLGASSLPFAVGTLHVKVAAGVVAFFGLLSYVAFIYTGRRGHVVALAAAYLVLFATLTYWYAWRAPIGVQANAWGAAVQYANDAPLVWDAITAALFLPPLAATSAFALLLRFVEDRRQRLRGGMVALSMATFFAGLTMSWLNGRWPWWGLIEKLLALVLVLGVLWTLRADAEEARRPAPGRPAAPVAASGLASPDR